MNRSIAYTSNWFHTLLISSILSVVIDFILIFLQPFDTYSYDIPYKNLILLGYSICIIIPIMLLHVLEEIWFRKSNKKWYVYQEIVILFLGILLTALASYSYNIIVINNQHLEINNMIDWAINFGFPFTPIFIPLWAYLRFRFSKITIRPKEGMSQKEVVIKGENQAEEVKFIESQFIMAKAQANYVDVFFLTDGQLEKQMIRSTISSLIEKISSAQQIHRSYLVNPAQIESISGNTRKGSVKIKHIDFEVPISPKHFVEVKKHLQNRP